MRFLVSSLLLIGLSSVVSGSATTADENGVDYHMLLHRSDNHNLRRRLGGKNKDKKKDKDKDNSGEDRNTGGGGGAIGGGAIGGEAGLDRAVLNPNGFDGLPCTSWISFVDSQGDDCVTYDLEPLKCGLVASQRRRPEDGLDANWACCICGGGDYANPGSTIQIGSP